MQPALISFIVSGVVIVAMVTLKAFVFKDRHVHGWVQLRQISDKYIHRSIKGTRGVSKKVTHQSLLKILSVVYHGIIPLVERVYRILASLVYKGHRKVWGLLAHSKQSTHEVSEYLRTLSEKKIEAQKEESVPPVE